MNASTFNVPTAKKISKNSSIFGRRLAPSEFKNLCVWSKTNAGMGSLYRSQHQLVFVFKNGTAAHTNNVELGRFIRSR